jgi:hypothetical protein
VNNNQQPALSTIDRLKKKWGVKNLFSVILILLVFALTGMTVVMLRPLVFKLFGYDETTPFLLKAVTYVLLIFPMYQTLILVYGAMLGQFSFFWEKEKKLAKFLIKPLRRAANRD